MMRSSDLATLNMLDGQSVCGIFLGMNSKNKAAIGEGMEYMRIFAKAALKTAYPEHWEAIKKHADDWLVQVCVFGSVATWFIKIFTNIWLNIFTIVLV